MKKLSGFSLMEMLTVLLIVSVIAGLTAPMVSKKLVMSSSIVTPWVQIDNINNVADGSIDGIAYVKEDSIVSIGDPTPVLNTDESSAKPKLYINSKLKKNSNRSESQISLKPQISIDNRDILNIIAEKGSIWLASLDKRIKLSEFKENSVVIGQRVQSTGINNTVIGCEASAKSDNVTAIGYKARIEVSSPSSIAIGNDAFVRGEKSITIGELSQVGGDKHISGDSYPEARTNNGISIGYQSTAFGENSISIGSLSVTPNVKAHGKNTISIGNDTFASSENAIAIGTPYYDTESNAESVLTQAKGNGSIAIGSGAFVLGQYGLALGKLAKAKNNYSISIGANANKEDDSDDADDNGQCSIALGSRAKASGDNSIAIGVGAVAKPLLGNAIAIGTNTEIADLFKDGIAIGNGAKATTTKQIVLGTVNDTVYIPGHLIQGKGSLFRYNTNYSTQRHLFDRQWGWFSIDNFLGIDAYENNAKHYFYESDRNLKNVGKFFSGGLNELNKLDVFNYTFKKDKSNIARVGVMAQDLKKIYPDAVIKGEDGFFKIRVEDMFYSLVNSIKELDNRLQTFRSTVLAQAKSDVDKIEKDRLELEKRLANLEKKLK